MLFGIFIYDGVEPIDLATFGVLSMARRIEPLQICTIGPRVGPILLASGLKVTADFGIDDGPSCDLVIVTGGPGWTAQAQALATLEYIRRIHASSRIASVCTGSMILAASGVLDGGPATTKREVVPPEMSPLEVMRTSYPQIDVREAMLVDRGGTLADRRRGLALYRHYSSSPRHYARQRVSDETARITEYQRASHANREGLASVLIMQ